MPSSAFSGVAPSHPNSCSVAAKRLMRDMQELAMENIELISAQPVNNNLFEWHCNLFGPVGSPYEGIALHLTLLFKDDYPMSPPKVTLHTPVPHPNVLKNVFNSESYSSIEENHLCLDMTNGHDFYKGTSYHSEPWTGWSSAYNISSLLVQLQGFLMAETVSQFYFYKDNKYMTPQNIELARKIATEFHCSVCGHTGTKPFPPLQHVDHKGPPSTTQYCQSKKTESSVLPIAITALPPLVLGEILTLLPPAELCRVSRTCKALRQCIQKLRISTRRQLICYHSKTPFTEDVLGIGLNVEFHPDGNIKSITSQLDLLSWTAYDRDRVRMGVWKHPFKYFLPMWINDDHGKRALPLIRKAIEAITELTPAPKSGGGAGARILAVLPALMNSFVVELVQDQSTETRQHASDDYVANYFAMHHDQSAAGSNIHRHASDKAMAGYCAIHQLLLAISRTVPDVMAEANKRVEAFVSSENHRSKEACPNIGEWLVLLTLAKRSWPEVATMFVAETFDRNVRWVLQKDPGLDKQCSLNTGASMDRIRRTFEGSKVSMRLLMFQVQFLRAFGRPPGKSLEMILNDYNSSLGVAPAATRQEMQRNCKKIMEVSGYDGVFPLIYMKTPDIVSLTDWLKQSIYNSERKRYHRPAIRISPQHQDEKRRR